MTLFIVNFFNEQTRQIHSKAVWINDLNQITKIIPEVLKLENLISIVKIYESKNDIE